MTPIGLRVLIVRALKECDNPVHGHSPDRPGSGIASALNRHTK